MLGRLWPLPWGGARAAAASSRGRGRLEAVRSAVTAGQAASPPRQPPLSVVSAGQADTQFSTRFSIDEKTLQLARTEGPVGAYESLVESGVLSACEQQLRIAYILSAIFHMMQGGGAAGVKGLYIYGSVGSGKSMLMDLFYACVSKHVSKCRRMHFHEFMHLVHRMMHRAKEEAPGERPADVVAQRISSEIGELLCFDEMAITTIQDCCLLAPIFEAMWRAGIVTVMTSNRAPEDLYSGGLNRHVHLPPFLNGLLANCKVAPLLLETDYRRAQVAKSGLSKQSVFTEEPGEAGKDFAHEWWRKATGGADEQREVFEGGYGRRLEVVAHEGVAMTSFQEMCQQNRSVEDYHALCNHYHTIILHGIPALDAENHNEARRFTNFVDASYEAHARLVACFEAPLSDVLLGLTALRDVGEDDVGHAPGCGDGDTSPSSSGVLEAVARMKAAVDKGPTKKEIMGSVFPGRPEILADSEAVTAAVSGEPVQDIQIWQQEEGMGAPQVSKNWDDRRRMTSFSWEAGDPTAEQQTIKGVFAAAVASLKETGFASARTESRLIEMQSNAYLDEWAVKRGIVGGHGGSSRNGAS